MYKKIETPIRYCIICGKEIKRNTKKGETRITPKQYIKSLYCSNKCRGIGRGKEMAGENHPLWKGGISRLPYSIDWTETLKRSIRERDHYVCRICGEQQTEKTFPVHHIDYNKKNCSPTNLITLCISCHSKTNYNREYWIEYFNNIQKNAVL